MKVIQPGFMVNVRDMGRAVAFYRDVIGLSVEMESPEWSALSCGDMSLGLHGGRKDDAVEQTGLYFYVDDIRAAVDEAVAGGATLQFGPKESEGEGISLADVADPEGNVFGFVQRLGTSA